MNRKKEQQATSQPTTGQSPTDELMIKLGEVFLLTMISQLTEKRRESESGEYSGQWAKLVMEVVFQPLFEGHAVVLQYMKLLEGDGPILGIYTPNNYFVYADGVIADARRWRLACQVLTAVHNDEISLWKLTGDGPVPCRIPKESNA